MSHRVTQRTILGLAIWAGYRLANTTTAIIFDTIGGTVVATTVSLAFNPYVNWALFFLIVYLAVSDLTPLSRESPVGALLVAASATAYALVWHAMYFRFTGRLPPTVIESGRRMAFVTCASFLSIYLFAPERNLSRTATLTVSAFALGLVGAAVAGLSPLPEILVLIGVLWTIGTTVTPSSQSRPLDAVDVEDRFVRGIIGATRNEKGRYALLVVSIGLLASILFLNAFVGVFYINYQGEIQSIGWSPFLTGATLITVYTAYGVWYWLRILRRLPAFLSSRAAVSANSEVTRPVGLLIPTAILAGGFANITANVSLPGLVAIACGVVAILWSIVATRRTAPQPIESDQYAIPISLVIQLVPFLAFGFPDTLVPIIVLPIVYFLPEIRVHTSDSAALGLVLGLLIVLGGLLWPLTVNRMLRMQVLPAELALATALFESISNRLS